MAVKRAPASPAVMPWGMSGGTTDQPPAASSSSRSPIVIRTVPRSMSVICSCSCRCTGKLAPGRNSYTVTVAPRPSNARRTTPGYGESASSSSILPLAGSLIDERHDSAGRRLAAFDGDRKRADQAAPAERVLDVAAHVLHVRDAGAERHAMHHEDVVLGEDVVHALGDVPLERLGRVGALVADRGVHRVVPGAAGEGGPRAVHKSAEH